MAVATSLVRGEEAGAGSRELGSFRKGLSGFIVFGLGSELGSFRKSLPRRGTGDRGRRIGFVSQECKWFLFVRDGLEIGFVS